MNLIKARETIFEYISGGLLDIAKVDELLSQKHATSYRSLHFWPIFESQYLRNASSKEGIHRNNTIQSN